MLVQSIFLKKKLSQNMFPGTEKLIINFGIQILYISSPLS